MLRYFKKVDKNPTSKVPGLTEEEVERANEEVKRVIEQKSGRRAKYNDYTPQQRANIGKYAAEHGPTRASHYFTKVLGKDVPESTVRRLRKEYLQKLKLTDNEDPQVVTLPKHSQGRPLLLGQELDKSVQIFIDSLRKTGGVVNTAIVVGAAHGIVSVHSPSLLREHGGHINLTKSWAKSLLKRMGYVKRKGSNAGKVTVTQFEELKEEFLADVKVEVLMNDIHKEMIFNWDQTGLQLVPTGQWTMHQAKAKVIPIVNSDDKRQITAVLAATMTGEYLHPQLIFKGKTPRCHPAVTVPQGWDFWHSPNHWSTEDTMVRYLENVIFPFVDKKREELKLEKDHPALAIFDCFKGQTTQRIYNLLEAHNIRVVQIPVNCTDKLQPMDISINKPMKEDMRRRFHGWYAENVRKQLEEGIQVENVKVETPTSLIKNESTKWMIQSWESVKQRPEIAINGFEKAGILQAINSVV